MEIENPNRFLVLDDEPAICELIKDVAEQTGFAVTTVNDAEQFRNYYRSFAPTSLVLDLQMPGDDGAEILRYLGEDNCDANILLVSGGGAVVERPDVRVEEFIRAFHAEVNRMEKERDVCLFG